MSSEMPFGSCPLPILDHKEVLLGHGSGGVLTSQLIEGLFLPAFGNPIRYPSCGTGEKLATQASVDSSSPKRRNEYTLPDASFASIQWKPSGVASRDQSAAVSP